MTETQAPPAAQVNGQAPAAAEPCEDCATSGEKIMATLAALIGAFVILMAVDMFTGGKLSGLVAEARGGE